MSELRKRCEELADSILDDIARYGISSVLRKNAVAELEAFAKQEQIKGMEAAKRHVCAEMLGLWRLDQDLHRMIAKIDAEISKLKEGG